MNTPLFSKGSASRSAQKYGFGPGFLTLGLVTVLGAASPSLFAQEAAPGAETPGGRRRGGAPGDATGERRTFNPEEMQARLMTQMRERFEVTDDEEWKLISDRLTKVVELRRATGGGGPGGFGAFGGRGPQGNTAGAAADARGARGGRGGGAGGAELAALSTALRDKLPDAEVKSRLDRLRETRKENEAKLVKAQEELRAVLSIRQEAQAVVFGMLP